MNAIIVRYNDDGDWYSTSEKTSIAALPEELKTAILSKYHKNNIQQIIKVETQNFKTYYDIAFHDERQYPIRFDELGNTVTSTNFRPDLLPNEFE